MRLLNKLAAWILKGKIRGVVLNVAALPNQRIPGWVFGDGWYINFGEEASVHEPPLWARSRLEPLEKKF